MLGVSQGFIGDIESGRSQPSTNFLQSLSEHFSVNPAWILEGREPQTFPHEPGFQSAVGRIKPASKDRPLAGHFEVDGTEFSLVRRMDIDVSAGNGLAIVAEEEKDRLAFSTNWLRKVRVAADLAALVRVRGDSMAPTIPDGATVLVNCAAKVIDKPGIFVCILDEEIYVKRVHQLTDADKAVGYVLVSDNPVYPPKVVAGRDLYRLRVIGQVSWVMHSV